MDIQDSVIMITGGSSGLGKTLATQLSSKKAKLILLSRSAEKLQGVASAIHTNGQIASCFSCDVTSPLQIQNAIQYALDAFGRLDVLINIATIWRGGKTEDHTQDNVHELFSVNTFGVINMIRETLPVMIKNQQGKIITVVSQAALKPDSTASIYTATKYAVRGLIESLQIELAEAPIQIIGVYPEGKDEYLFNTAEVSPEELEMATSARDQAAEQILHNLTI